MERHVKSFSRSRKRPPRADRRARYLEVAEELFGEHGFVGTSMDMIVERVGGSKATLYALFPSKDELIAALMDDVITTMGQRSSYEKIDTFELREALTAIGRATLDGVMSDRAIRIFRLCLGECTRFPELARVVWNHGPKVTYARFRSFLEERERRGEVSVPDTQFAAEQFLAGIVGHLQARVAMGITGPPTPAERKARVASAVETFVARYAVRSR